MSAKLPPVSDTIEFLERAEEIADGDRQTKYVAGVVQEFATFVNKAEDLEKDSICLLQLKTFVDKKMREVAVLAADNVSEHYEGCFEAYDTVLRFIKGEISS